MAFSSVVRSRPHDLVEGLAWVNCSTSSSTTIRPAPWPSLPSTTKAKGCWACHLHDDTGGENAEFAILVRSRLKGHGVGWLLMKHMIEFSRHKDLKTVRGQVLAENATMLAMCAELGFHIAVDPDDPSVKTVTPPVHPAHLTLR